MGWGAGIRALPRRRAHAMAMDPQKQNDRLILQQAWHNTHNNTLQSFVSRAGAGVGGHRRDSPPRGSTVPSSPILPCPRVLGCRPLCWRYTTRARAISISRRFSCGQGPE